MGHKESDYFRAALCHEIEKRGRGSQSVLSIDAGLEHGYISQLKKGKRIGSPEVQSKIAAAFGYEYGDFINFGKQLLSGSRPAAPSKKPVYQAKYQPLFDDLVEIVNSGNGQLIKAIRQNLQEFKESAKKDTNISGMQGDMNLMRTEIDQLKRDLEELKKPLPAAQIVTVAKPETSSD